MKVKTEPLISVIIATKNEGRNIAHILRSLQKQTYKNFETIVVDLNSSDNTARICARFKARVVVMKPKALIGIKNFRGAQVNHGFKKSKGEIIFFPDADMVLDKNLLKEISLATKKFDALYIPEIIKTEDLFGRIRNFERSFYNETPIDAVRVLRRELYQRIGGYDEMNIMFGPDDWDLTKRIKKVTDNIAITNTSIVHRGEKGNLFDYLEKKSRYIPTFDDYIKKWGENDPDIIKQFGVSYRMFGVFVENGKWKKILRHPELFIGVTLIKLLVGVEYAYYLATTW